MFEAIYDLLANLISDLYSLENIFIANQNNYTLPKNNNYILINELDTESFGMPQYKYDQAGEIETYNNLDGTEFQIDFYGNNSLAASKKIRIALQSSYATTFLYNNYGYTIYKVGNDKNLTSLLDQGDYVERYMLRFSIFNNNYLTANQISAESATINLYYAGNKTGSIIKEA